MSSRQKAPQQYKQSSRKGKKAWRKHVDVTEVEGGLEQLRDEMLLGGPMAERPSDDIFTVDTKGSETIRSKHKRELKPLKVDQILAQRSKVPSVDSRKRSIRKLADLISEPASKRTKGWVSHAQLQVLRENLKDNNNLSDRRLEHQEAASLDLWEDNAVETDRMSHLEKAKPIVAPATLQHAPIAMTAHGKPVKAVQVPAAGASYNPDFADWDDLLNREGQKQVEIENKKLVEEGAEAERAARIATIAEGPEDRTDDESAWEGMESDYDKSEWLSKRRPKRKTQAQVNKLKRRKQSESQILHEAKIANKKQQAQQIQELSCKSRLETVGDDERQLIDELAAAAAEEQGDDLLRRKRLRNVNIPTKPLEVVLPDELQDSLRRLKPEGRLLDDRFRHLMVNGKIEARNRVLKTTRKKVKYTEKWSHKDFSIEV